MNGESNRIGIVVFLGMTLAASFGVEAYVLIAGGNVNALFLLVAIPGIAGFVASRVDPIPAEAAAVWHPVPVWKMARIAVLATLLFGVSHGAMFLLGWSAPDLLGGELMARIPSLRAMKLSPVMTLALPKLVLAAGFVMSVILGPTAYAALALPVEYGWRGYFAARTDARYWTACGVGGILWGASLAPLVFLQANGPVWIEAVLAGAMALVLSLLLGGIWRRMRSVILCATALGCFVCQASTFWPTLFPDATTHFPWSGPLGMVSIGIWGIAALFPRLWVGPRRAA